MPDQPVIDFRSELLRMTAPGQFPNRLIITLLNGDRFSVESPLQLVIGQNVGSAYPRGGVEVFFPFYSICSVEIHRDAE